MSVTAAVARRPDRVGYCLLVAASANGEVAPFQAIRSTAIEPLESTP
jgi:hypothetical protein